MRPTPALVPALSRALRPSTPAFFYAPPRPTPVSTTPSPSSLLSAQHWNGLGVEPAIWSLYGYGRAPSCELPSAPDPSIHSPVSTLHATAPPSFSERPAKMSTVPAPTLAWCDFLSMV